MWNNPGQKIPPGDILARPEACSVEPKVRTNRVLEQAQFPSAFLKGKKYADRR
jgi:hypothetical protein